MPIIEANFPVIRRFEAVSFRSFPATTTYFNGTWAIRLTAGHPARRLNSINPLDPGDSWNIARRLEQEVKRFDSFGRPIVFRLTPLAPPSLVSHLDELGWGEFGESVVMAVDLDGLDLDNITDRLPYKDTGHWVDSFLKLEGESEELKPGMVEVISAAHGRTELFLLEGDDLRPHCVMRMVLDNEVIGLFNIVTDKQHQRKGLATSLLLSAMRWARFEGAQKAWLQVESENKPAISLYQSLGFKEIYRYVYRHPPTQE